MPCFSIWLSGKGRAIVPGQDSIQVVCQCGKKLKAPATAVGKKARCPACGNTMVLSAPKVATEAAPRKTPAPATVLADDDGLAGLYDLADQANSAPTLAPTQTIAVPAPTVSAKPTLNYAAQKKDPLAPQGSFVAGIAMSIAYALAASVLWFLVAYFTGVSIGYIGALIGLAAGLGMRAGLKGFNTLAGYTASAITLAAILVAKFAVLEAVLAQRNLHVSIFNARGEALFHYFFSPIGIIIMLVGMGAAFRSAKRFG